MTLRESQRVEAANKIAPKHSRIFDEMIMMVRPDKPLPRTPKGTIMHRLALKNYSNEIEALYALHRFLVVKLFSAAPRYEELASKSSSRNQVEPPLSWDVISLKEWLIGQLSQMFAGKVFSTSADLFEQGCDRYEYTSIVEHNTNKFAQFGSHIP